jgi:transposase
MRKSFEGLGTIVEQLFPGELLSSALFIFLNRQRNCMKALFWDRDGFAIFYKRLERGTFTPNTKSNLLDRREFMMLLEGITPQKMRPKFSPKKE